MRGSLYIPYGDLPAAAFEIPGVRRSARTGQIMVPWHAHKLVMDLGYTGGFAMRPGKRIESPLAFSADPIADHPFVSDETRHAATRIQREDLRRTIATSGGILDWPTGSGKTLIGLAFATSFGLAAQGGPRALIVVPSTTTDQWRRQASRWLSPEVKVGVVIQGRPTVTRRRSKTYRTDDQAVRQRMIKAGASLTLFCRLAWADEDLRDDERALLRKVKAPVEVQERWFLTDDLGASVGGPFDSAAEAEARRGTWAPGDYDVIVVGWGVLPQPEVRDALLLWNPGVLVVDEAHRLGKQGSMWRKVERAADDQRSEYERKLGAASNVHAISAECAKAALLMTATPQGDLPKNWHTLLDVYEPYSFGSFSTFGMRYADGHRGQYAMVYDGLSHADELRARLSHFWYYRSKAETHADLPPVRREFVTLDLRRAGRVDLTALGADLRDGDAGGSPTAMQIAVATEQKVSWAVDRIGEYLRSGLRVFVWVMLRANARRLEVELRERGFAGPSGPVSIYRADGSLTSAERAALVDRFVQEPGGAVMVGTIAAFGEAIDGLQHVDVALVLTVPWTPQMLIQGPEGRHSRRGGTRNVLLVYTKLAGTIDDVIWSRMGEKLGMVAEVRNDQDARNLGGEIAGDSPEAQTAALASMADTLTEWQGAAAAWKDYERDVQGIEGIDLDRLG